jgi:uncharacterized protein YqjF (DUF2071 family)
MPRDFSLDFVRQQDHRPWGVPDRPWIMRQSWHDLLFAHWPVRAEDLRSKVLGPFEIDTYDGAAWVGVIPFHMTNVTARGLPALPGVSAFPELNVRTYVKRADKPGVYFFSLDAGSSLAVGAARALFNLPYFTASMELSSDDSGVRYESRRSRRLDRLGEFEASYRPIGAPVQPAIGTIEYFLTERYCLYNTDRRGRPYKLEIHHPPWQLQAAVAEFKRNTMAEAAGIALPDRAPLLHLSKRQDMVGWWPTRIEGA